MTDLQTIRASWDEAARGNATFNILTDPEYMNGWPLDEFFAHGRLEIDSAMERLDGLGVKVKKGRALDFGCGIGRLTQALTHHFTRVDGVDLSFEMVTQAFDLDTTGARFHHNTRPDLKLFKARSFDFIYSMIVLQHMPKALQGGYVHEFFRILKPGGVAMVELVDGPDAPHVEPWLSMYGVPRTTVEQWITAAGGTVVDIETIPEPSEWDCNRYTAVAA